MSSIRRSWVLLIVTVAVASLLVATPVQAAESLPILWQAGGLSAGTDSAGQAARVAADAAGNIAVVSGPSDGRDLAVTSYTATGSLRWTNAVSPSIGTFQADWVAAAPNGDFVAVGHNVGSTGNPIAITLVRFGSNGTLQWRVDLARTFPSVARLLVDSGGNAYLAFNSVGDGHDIQVHKYSPSGALLWSQVIATGFLANDVATSLALSPGGTDVVVTGNIVGGATWITALYDAATGVRRWLVTGSEGTTTRDVVVDSNRVYVTGQGSVGINGYLSVIAYDRATGARLWRRDSKPIDAGDAAGLRIALAPDGSVVATGQALRGFLDWYTVALDTTGAVRWAAVRDGGLNTNEIPASLLVLPDGTTVVTGTGGPNLPGGFIPGVSAGYSPSGALVWEAFSPLATAWATALPNGDVCATGGYDAYVACFRPTGGGGGTEAIHIADLDGSAVTIGRTWTATVVVTVADDSGTPVAGAVVAGIWKRGTVATCTTNASGMCTAAITASGKSEVFTVTGVTHPTSTYDSGANTDPDGDSNGTAITINRQPRTAG